MYVDMACIVMYDDISIARSKRSTKKLYFVTLFRMKTSFHAKVQVCGSHGLSVMTDMACIIVLLGRIIGCFTRNKRVNE